MAGEGRLRTGGVAAALALVVLLPFLRGLMTGQSFFFRDLSLSFFPLRRFAVEGLRVGELRFWNPFVHEGVPLTVLPISYPADLLQVLVPNEWGFSLLLALHVALAALAFLALARSLGLCRLAAAGGGIVFALGGFCLSTLHLYVYLQAVAWAPLVVLGLRRAGAGGRKEVALAALLVAVAVSTTAAEVVAQTVLLGLALSVGRREPAAWGRVGAALGLGLTLAAYPILPMMGILAGTARGQGFPTDVVLAHSVHPLTLLQILVGSLYGDLSSLADHFWGQNFFPLGFPYFLSLYLGLAVMALAAVGAAQASPLRGRLLLLGGLGVVVSLGRWAGLVPLVEALPLVHAFRYPSKAFFTVHFVASALTAFGLQALSHQRRPGAWRLLAALSLPAGLLFVAAPTVPTLAPGPTLWFLRHFFPPDYSWALRPERLRLILEDAAVGGGVAMTLGVLAILVAKGHLDPRRGGLAAVGLLAADLLRTGAGLNPMATPSFYAPSSEMPRHLFANGRIFTCSVQDSPSYRLARLAKGGDHQVWSFATLAETLTPLYNLRAAVRSAYSPDLTMLVPLTQLLSLEEGTCSSFSAIAERLRRAGVAHVLSLDPIASSELRLEAEVAPPRIAPLVIRVYALASALPLRFVARQVRVVPDRAEPPTDFVEDGGTAVEGEATEVAGAEGRILLSVETPDTLEFAVEADRPTVLVVRDAFATGWSATVNGAAVPILRADGRHRAVAIPAHLSQVNFRYRPPGLLLGLALSGLTATVLILLWASAGRGSPRPRPPGPLPTPGAQP